MPCDNTTMDPGLADLATNTTLDPIISIDDGVTHWWLSDDIRVTSSSGVNGEVNVDAAADNRLEVRVHQANPGLAATARIRIQLYAAAPTTSISPANSVLVGTKSITPATVPVGGAHSADPWQEFLWRPTAADVAIIGGTGHKCLIARTYPNNLTPDPGCLSYVIPDQHYAQRNIALVRVPQGGGKGIMKLTLASPSMEKAEQVVLVARAEFNPRKRILERLIREAKYIDAFKGFVLLEPGHIRKLLQAGDERTLAAMVRRAVPERFRLDLGDSVKAKISDLTRPRLSYDKLGRLVSHRYIARFEMEPRQIIQYPLEVELGDTRPGDAHIFHVVQYGHKQQQLGGITVIFVTT